MVGRRRAPFPGFVAPALATQRKEPPTGAKWLHEVKFDGYRLQAHVRSGDIKLLTRTGLDWTRYFGPDLCAAFRSLPVREAILDGEVVVQDADGIPNFSALQDALATRQTGRLLCYVFDLLYLDGHDLRGLPLLERKSALAEIVNTTDTVRYVEHLEGDGGVVLRHACQLRLEGIVSKRADAPYRSGRSLSWVKVKCSQRQAFIIAGYVPRRGSMSAVGALVLGRMENGKLVYAGRVGTGFSEKVAAELYARLETMRAPGCAFAKKLSPADARGVRFVRPELVAGVEFRAWTADGLVRHAVFLGYDG